MTVAARLSEVRGRIDEACRRAGRDSASVTLLAVSKKQPDEALEAAYIAGQRDFGENYVQELVRKAELLPQARFHLIGHLQTNKAKKAVVAHMIHTVDSARVARALAKHVDSETRLSVLLEVNLAREAQKAGLHPEAVREVLETVGAEPRLEVRGLMCIPPVGEGRRCFAALRELAERTRRETGLSLPELSMGMSADYEDAILEGSTMVRVGTAVFGPRNMR